MSWARLGGAVLAALWPPQCPLCGGESDAGAGLCPHCLDAMEPLAGPVCPLCGRPEAGEGCPACAQAPPAFSGAFALARHQGPLAQAVRDFKYKRRLATGAALGRLLAGRARARWLRDVTLVAPVPLHRRRLWRRGFNQALLLARPLCARHALALAPDLLRRVRPTRPQVGLSPRQRRENVAGAFALRPGVGDLAGAVVLLVDDVFTTGATADECARVLLAGGAGKVRTLTLTRAGGAAAVAAGGGPGYDGRDA